MRTPAPPTANGLVPHGHLLRELPPTFFLQNDPFLLNNDDDSRGIITTVFYYRICTVY